MRRFFPSKFFGFGFAWNYAFFCFYSFLIHFIFSTVHRTFMGTSKVRRTRVKHWRSLVALWQLTWTKDVHECGHCSCPILINEIEFSVLIFLLKMTCFFYIILISFYRKNFIKMWYYYIIHSLLANRRRHLNSSTIFISINLSLGYCDFL